MSEAQEANDRAATLAHEIMNLLDGERMLTTYRDNGAKRRHVALAVALRIRRDGTLPALAAGEEIARLRNEANGYVHAIADLRTELAHEQSEHQMTCAAVVERVKERDAATTRAETAEKRVATLEEELADEERDYRAIWVNEAARSASLASQMTELLQTTETHDAVKSADALRMSRETNVRRRERYVAAEKRVAELEGLLCEACATEAVMNSPALAPKEVRDADAE